MCPSRKGATLGRGIKPVVSERLKWNGFSQWKDGECSWLMRVGERGCIVYIGIAKSFNGSIFRL